MQLFSFGNSNKASLDLALIDLILKSSSYKSTESILMTVLRNILLAFEAVLFSCKTAQLWRSRCEDDTYLSGDTTNTDWRNSRFLENYLQRCMEVFEAFRVALVGIREFCLANTNSGSSRLNQVLIGQVGSALNKLSSRKMGLIQIIDFSSSNTDGNSVSNRIIETGPSTTSKLTIVLGKDKVLNNYLSRCLAILDETPKSDEFLSASHDIGVSDRHSGRSRNMVRGNNFNDIVNEDIEELVGNYSFAAIVGGQRKFVSQNPNSSALETEGSEFGFGFGAATSGWGLYGGSISF